MQTNVSYQEDCEARMGEKALTPGYHDVAGAHMSDLPGFSHGILPQNQVDQDVFFEDLEVWFSDERMARYSCVPDPAGLYAWDNTLSKAYLEDIAHVEVLLRNFMADRLSRECERAFGDGRWYERTDYFNFNSKFVESRDEVRERILSEGHAVTPGRMTAGLTLGAWYFMLAKGQEPTVWKALRDVRNGGMPNYPSRSRREFHEKVGVVWRLRNRCAHHEHLASADVREEGEYLDRYSDAIGWVASRIDPRAARWISANSRVAAVRARRPARGSAGISKDGAY